MICESAAEFFTARLSDLCENKRATEQVPAKQRDKNWDANQIKRSSIRAFFGTRMRSGGERGSDQRAPIMNVRRFGVRKPSALFFFFFFGSHLGNACF